MPLRLDAALNWLLGWIAGDSPKNSLTSQHRLPPPTALALPPERPRLVSLATLGVVLLAGDRHCDALLDCIASWGEAHDLTWIE
jgi:hypothetical protein